MMTTTNRRRKGDAGILIITMCRVIHNLLWVIPALLLVVSFASMMVFSTTILPRPPRQTEHQREAWLQIAQEAEEASQKALPELLSYLDSSSFRAQIANLSFANESASVVLEMLDEAYMTAPFFHNINGGREEDLNPWDIYFFQQVNLSFIPNEWQTHLMGDMNNSWLHPVYWEETHMFHLPKLPDINNVTVKQAEGRMLNSGVNAWRFASGLAAYYGGVGFVLSPSYIRNMTALSPYDLGFYHACCVANWTSCTQHLNFKCAPFVPGTFEHHNHLYLQTTYFWQLEFFGEILQRTYSSNPPKAKMGDVVYYWEGDVLGNIVFPEGVQYINADFTSLFADSRGKLLIEWCRQNNWTLVWGFSFINEYNDQIYEVFQGFDGNL
eukprot:TRINITY_DN1947_c1_g2_i3.p1 TRINITY_DN1947_c1_g2~~TRINITY_DN1947_c1_g2_i3.p1  ORF type:complete len:382 (-),score=82.84 TRINITY_DN1947_c1_g2_i3:78-1223(-)